MSKPIYFTRHGQTVWNVENKICGATDIALTDYGHEQAILCGKQLKEEMDQGKIQIDQILSSPLVRASETARHISEETGIPMRLEERLREQNFGYWESTPRNGEGFAVAKTHFIDSYGSGETMLMMAHRIYSLLEDLKKDDKIYLLVAHNGISRFIQSYFYDMTNEEFSRFGIKNCQILKYTL